MVEIVMIVIEVFFVVPKAGANENIRLVTDRH